MILEKWPAAAHAADISEATILEQPLTLAARDRSAVVEAGADRHVERRHLRERRNRGRHRKADRDCQGRQGISEHVRSRQESIVRTISSQAAAMSTSWQGALVL